MLFVSVEYTDMAKYAERVMKANGVEDVVTVIQGAVEEVELPTEDGEQQVVDIIISEWMVCDECNVFVSYLQTLHVMLIIFFDYT